VRTLCSAPQSFRIACSQKIKVMTYVTADENRNVPLYCTSSRRNKSEVSTLSYSVPIPQCPLQSAYQLINNRKMSICQKRIRSSTSRYFSAVQRYSNHVFSSELLGHRPSDSLHTYPFQHAERVKFGPSDWCRGDW
jgi:hypothetical protein